MPNIATEDSLIRHPCTVISGVYVSQDSSLYGGSIHWKSFQPLNVAVMMPFHQLTNPAIHKVPLQC